MSLELDTRIDSLTLNLRPYVRTIFKQLARLSQDNATILCDFLIAEQTEMNIKDSTKEWKIKVLVWLARDEHLGNKSFKQMTKQDILLYLNKLRKPDAEDPSHKWIGTYNNRVMLLTKFFRWLYNPDEPDYRKRTTPPCMNGVKQLPRKEKSPYKPEDIWTPEEHAIFLKYCPLKRDKCYHAMINDTSARPHEILNPQLHIASVNIKLSETGIRYGEIHVTGKTGTRTLPLIDSLPYFKEWIGEHPLADNPNTPLFVSLSDQNFGQPLSRNGLGKQYSYYKKRYFPRLLDNSSVPLKDKEIIRRMLKKPWNLYILRHSALTQKSQILKESTLRDHAGWTMSSKMPSVYIHYFGTESSKSLLEAAGVLKSKDKQSNPLKAKACPNCSEPNKAEAKFCAQCKFVLSYDGFKEAVTKKDDEVKELKDEIYNLYKILYAQGIIKKDG